MSPNWPLPIQGGCGCGYVRYQLNRQPLFTHCCNCHQCQRETGSAFVLNSLVEPESVVLQPPSEESTERTLKHILMPTGSGKDQVVARCPRCYVPLWSYFPDNGPHLKFLKLATLDKQAVDGTSVEELIHPEAFIFTKFKQPWVPLSDAVSGTAGLYEEFYEEKKIYTSDAYQRLEAVRERGREWTANGRNWSELGDIEDAQSS